MPQLESILDVLFVVAVVGLVLINLPLIAGLCLLLVPKRSVRVVGSALIAKGFLNARPKRKLRLMDTFVIAPSFLGAGLFSTASANSESVWGWSVFDVAFGAFLIYLIPGWVLVMGGNRDDTERMRNGKWTYVDFLEHYAEDQVLPIHAWRRKSRWLNRCLAAAYGQEPIDS